MYNSRSLQHDSLFLLQNPNDALDVRNKMVK